MTTKHPNFEDSIILFADLQLGIADLPLTVPSDILGKSVAALAKLATLRDVPVIVSAVRGMDGSDPTFIPALANNMPNHTLCLRTVCDSAQDPAIIDTIKASGRKKILISGVATEIAVSLPAFTLAEHGYEVFVVVDACSGLSPRTEDAVFKTLVSAGVNLTTVASVAGVFAEDMRDPLGQQAVGILMAMAGG